MVGGMFPETTPLSAPLDPFLVIEKSHRHTSSLPPRHLPRCCQVLESALHVRQAKAFSYVTCCICPSLRRPYVLPLHLVPVKLQALLGISSVHSLLQRPAQPVLPQLISGQVLNRSSTYPVIHTYP